MRQTVGLFFFYFSKMMILSFFLLSLLFVSPGGKNRGLDPRVWPEGDYMYVIGGGLLGARTSLPAALIVTAHFFIHSLFFLHGTPGRRHSTPQPYSLPSLSLPRSSKRRGAVQTNFTDWLRSLLSLLLLLDLSAVPTDQLTQQQSVKSKASGHARKHARK